MNIPTPYVIAILVLVLVAIIYVLFFNRWVAEARAIWSQARRSYSEARGTAHCQLLSDIQRTTNRQQTANEKALAQARKQLRTIETAYSQEHDRVLRIWLVRSRLQEVPGISERLKSAIVAEVFDGTFESLRFSHKVHGIGEHKQRAINQWVQHYSRIMPMLRNQEDFPNKQQIKRKYSQQIRRQRETIEHLKAEETELAQRAQRLDQELSWLREIRVRNFANVLRNPERISAELTRYEHGVFAEWEPVPDWLIAAIEATSTNSDLLTSLANSPARLINRGWKRLKEKGLHWNMFWGKQGFRRAALLPLLLIGACALGSLWIALTPSSAEERPSTPTTSDNTEQVVPTSLASPTFTAVATATLTPTAVGTSTATAVATSTPEATETAVPPAKPQIRVSVTRANIRSGPGVENEVVGFVNDGQIFDVLEETESGDWLKIVLENGTEGWVGSQVVELIAVE